MGLPVQMNMNLWWVFLLKSFKSFLSFLWCPSFWFPRVYRSFFDLLALQPVGGHPPLILWCTDDHPHLPKMYLNMHENIYNETGSNMRWSVKTLCKRRRDVTWRDVTGHKSLNWQIVKDVLLSPWIPHAYAMDTPRHTSLSRDICLNLSKWL